MVAEDLPTFYPHRLIFFLTGSWDAVILTDFVVGILLVEVGGRLRRPFRGGAFLRTSASPRGGAMIALPLHGIYGVFFVCIQIMNLKDSSFGCFLIANCRTSI